MPGAFEVTAAGRRSSVAVAVTMHGATCIHSNLSAAFINLVLLLVLLLE